MTQHLSHLAGVRARLKNRFLRAAELCRRDHLHGLGDLLRALNTADTAAYVA